MISKIFILMFLINNLIIINANQQTVISPDDFGRIQKEMNSINPSNNLTLNSEGHLFNPNSPYAKALEAIFGIGVRLQLLLEKTEANKKNFLVSPISMAVTVGELMLGARGDLRNYLAELLVIDGANLITDKTAIGEKREDIPLLNIHQQLGTLLRDLQQHGDLENTYILETASALFLQPELRLNKLFEDSIRSIYDTSILPVNFSTDPLGSFKYINNWATKSTRGKINQILPAPLPVTSSAVLANAIYFKADWETPFSDELSAEGIFHTAQNESVKITYLRGQFDISYAESKELNCSMIVLPYKNKKMSMYVILPKKGTKYEYDLKSFTTSLRSKDVFDLIKLTQLRSVRVILPKINLSSTISLLDPLKKYQEYKDEIQKMPKLLSKYSSKPLTNKYDILDEKIETYKDIEKEISLDSRVDITVGTKKDPIDLSGASLDARFKLTDIVQQMSLAINEKGTEAAAITASTISLSGGIKNFEANRPFMFFIRHEMTEAILFWGTIVNAAH